MKYNYVQTTSKPKSTGSTLDFGVAKHSTFGVVESHPNDESGSLVLLVWGVKHVLVIVLSVMSKNTELHCRLTAAQFGSICGGCPYPKCPCFPEDHSAKLSLYGQKHMLPFQANLDQAAMDKLFVELTARVV